MRLRMTVDSELTEYGEIVLHPNVADERDELARRFIIRASVREAVERHAAWERIRRTTVWDPRLLLEFAFEIAGLVEGHACADTSEERMNSLEGVGETAASPQLKRARLEEQLEGEQEGRNRTRQSRRRAHDEEPRATQLINREFYFGQTSTRSRNTISFSTRWTCFLVPKSGTRSMGRVGEEPRVTQLVNNPREPLIFATPSREVEEPLFFETTSPGPYVESWRNSVINMGPIRRLRRAQGEF